jgi:alkylhydroperoxidase/carboxymuconolactone decarboxylase family protein YurZ
VSTVDLSALVSTDTLQRFKESYSPAFMLAASRAAVAAPHPAASGLVEWVMGYLYDGVHLKPVDRERTLIAVLASQSTSSSFTLAVHLYWGLMEGLPVAEIADTLCLSATYTGLPHYAAGLTTFQKTLQVLSSLSVALDGKLDPKTVVSALRIAFP